MLERRFPGMRIAEAEDADSAFRHAMTRAFDLIFMDIRLPNGNGLDLTKIIKRVHEEVVICVLTGYDILEYREAAMQNGADHFMVKGDTNESEIIGLVDRLLHTRFITLIVDSDPMSRRQIDMLLNIHWPDMVVEEAPDLGTGVDLAMQLQPDLVLFELALGGDDPRRAVQQLRFGRPDRVVVGMAGGEVLASVGPGVEGVVDHCVSITPFGHTELVRVVESLHPQRKLH
jgi:DNA-binding NarL/FixJ family response regulator